MTLKPPTVFKTLEDLLEQDSLSDEPSCPPGQGPRCHCGRFARSVSAPRVNIFGEYEFQVRCSEHGLVWVS